MPARAQRCQFVLAQQQAGRVRGAGERDEVLAREPGQVGRVQLQRLGQPQLEVRQAIHADPPAIAVETGPGADLAHAGKRLAEPVETLVDAAHQHQVRFRAVEVLGEPAHHARFVLERIAVDARGGGGDGRHHRRLDRRRVLVEREADGLDGCRRAHACCPLLHCSIAHGVILAGWVGNRCLAAWHVGLSAAAG
nr:hypothetical protein [Burkholderia gladioli]